MTVNAYQDGNQMYIRRSSITGYSIFVHEGTHVIDHLNDIPQSIISSFDGELKAYMNEHDYQKKKGEHVDYKDKEEIIVHIKLNYR